jgi:hypothetical protein
LSGQSPLIRPFHGQELRRQIQTLLSQNNPKPSTIVNPNETNQCYQAISYTRDSGFLLHESCDRPGNARIANEGAYGKASADEQQQKALTPIVAQRDKAIKSLMGNTSMGKLQKLRKVQAIQTDFREQAGKVLTPEQSKKLEALQAERREKLMGS